MPASVAHEAESLGPRFVSLLGLDGRWRVEGLGSWLEDLRLSSASLSGGGCGKA